MKSDITRDTFSARKHFSRVVQQQGRVTIDADSNEQTSILLHYLRALALDLIGPYAGPAMDGGFRLSTDSDGRLLIGAGRYYVNGLLVENETSSPYTEQPHNPLAPDDAFAKAIADKDPARYWVYLDVWERHITALEDDSIREKALGGPDTCTRAKVVWQVKALDMDPDVQQDSRAKRRQWLEGKANKLRERAAQPKGPLELERIKEQIAKIDGQLNRLNGQLDSCAAPLDQLPTSSDASLGARVDPGPRIVDPCVTSPNSKYRGAENRLYRVEIHRGGVAGEATFKWSGDNGSVVTAWLNTSDHDLEVANATGFSEGNWVELIDDVAELHGAPGVLVRLAKVEGGTLSVDPDSFRTPRTPDDIRWDKTSINPKVRRWDHFATQDVELESDGSILIEETPIGTPDDAPAAKWIDLKDGIQVQFAEGGEYRPGDYWLIPARVEMGDIEWPESPSDASDTFTTHLAPHGVAHYFAPLGFVGWPGEALQIESCYCEFNPSRICVDVTPSEDRRPGIDEIPSEPLESARLAGKIRPERASKKRARRTSKKASSRSTRRPNN